MRVVLIFYVSVRLSVCCGCGGACLWCGVVWLVVVVHGEVGVSCCCLGISSSPLVVCLFVGQFFR